MKVAMMKSVTRLLSCYGDGAGPNEWDRGAVHSKLHRQKNSKITPQTDIRKL